MAVRELDRVHAVFGRGLVLVVLRISECLRRCNSFARCRVRICLHDVRRTVAEIAPVFVVDFLARIFLLPRFLQLGDFRVEQLFNTSGNINFKNSNTNNATIQYSPSLGNVTNGGTLNVRAGTINIGNYDQTSVITLNGTVNMPLYNMFGFNVSNGFISQF